MYTYNNLRSTQDVYAVTQHYTLRSPYGKNRAFVVVKCPITMKGSMALLSLKTIIL